jgi:hypothetical protein
LDEPSEATAAAAGVDGDTHQQQQKERTPDEVARLAAELHEACQSLDVERAEAVLKAAKQKGFEKLRAALAGLNAQGETPLVHAPNHVTHPTTPILTHVACRALYAGAVVRCVCVCGGAML